MRPHPFLYCLVAGFGLLACNRHAADSGEAKARGGAPEALAAVVLNAATVTSNVIATGTVLAEHQVDVQTEISGKVVHIGFPEGGHVAAGQELVKLDDSELRAQYEKAKAQLLLAQVQEKRMQPQFEAGAVSQQDVDQARAQLESAQADAALIKAQLDKCEIRAPFAGDVGLRLVELGSVLQPGTKVTTLQDLHSFRIEFSVPEDQTAGVRIGLPVKFTVTGRKDTLNATIFAIEPALDPSTRLMTVRARCPAPKGGLRPGAFATVEVPVHATQALWVPAQGVVESSAGSQVWLVRDGKAKLQVFRPGTRTPEAVEAVQGLSAGDTVLVSGLMQLHPGIPVKPKINS